jgi:hypothetical protein
MADNRNLDRLVQLLKRRANGEWTALDVGAWADETTSWHCYDTMPNHLNGAQRAAKSRAEHEMFAQAMPDFRRESVFHVSEATNVIVEVSTWVGTGPEGGERRLPMCVVYGINDKGRIESVSIYDDSSQSKDFGSVLRLDQ